jgi:WD40 repeat protein
MLPHRLLMAGRATRGRGSIFIADQSTPFAVRQYLLPDFDVGWVETFNESPRALVLSKTNNSILYSGGNGGLIRSIDADTGNILDTFSVPSGSSPIWGIDSSPDGNSVYASYQDSVVRRTDANTGALGWTYTGYSGSIIYTARVSHDGIYVFSSSGHNTVHRKLASNGSGGEILNMPSTITGMALSPDSTIVYSGDRSGRVRASNSANGSQAWQVMPGLGDQIRLCTSYDGQYIYCVSYGGNFIKLDASNGATIWSRDMNGENGREVKAMPDGSQVYATTTSGSVYGVDEDDNDGNIELKLFRNGSIFLGLEFRAIGM